MKDQVMIVTGAAMGLGLAAAKVLAARGAAGALVDYNADALKTAQAELAAECPQAKTITVTADVSDEAAVKRYVDATVEAFGRVDGLYNNAGIEGRQAPMTEYDLDVFRKVLEIQVMQQQGYGRIVNAASVGGIRGVLNQTAYVASKHAVVGMSRNAALEYGQHGILTNAIAPGAILTPMVAEAFKQVNPADPKGAEAQYASRNPTRRLGARPTWGIWWRFC